MPLDCERQPSANVLDTSMEGDPTDGDLVIPGHGLHASMTDAIAWVHALKLSKCCSLTAHVQLPTAGTPSRRRQALAITGRYLDRPNYMQNV